MVDIEPLCARRAIRLPAIKEQARHDLPKRSELTGWPYYDVIGDMKDLLHVTDRGGCLLRLLPFSRALRYGASQSHQLCSGGRFIAAVVVLRRVAQEFCENYVEPVIAGRLQSVARRRWQRRLR